MLPVGGRGPGADRGGAGASGAGGIRVGDSSFFFEAAVGLPVAVVELLVEQGQFGQE